MDTLQLTVKGKKKNLVPITLKVVCVFVQWCTLKCLPHNYVSLTKIYKKKLQI